MPYSSTMPPVNMDRPEPPRITKADALDRYAREWGHTRGAAAGVAHLIGVARQAIYILPLDKELPELYARRLKDVRPAWFADQPLQT